MSYERNMRSEAAERADFSEIRYAQVWEDADVLLEASTSDRVTRASRSPRPATTRSPC